MEVHLTPIQLLRNSILKLIFEMIGTIFLTITFNCTLYKQNVLLQEIPNFQMNQTALLLTIWVLTIFGLKISGAHYNPAISFAYMLRRDVGSNFPRLLGLAYILFQCLGGFLGALLSWFLRVDPQESGNVFVVGDGGVNVFAAIVAEVIGSFFVSFFFLTQTEEKTVFSKEKAINCFIIASAYVGARGMLNGNAITESGAVLNPAIALGTSFTQLFDVGATRFKWVWIYTLFPFAGSILAVLFYEFVFKKTQEVLNEGEEEEDDNDTLLDK